MRVALTLVALLIASAVAHAADSLAFVTACRTTARDPSVDPGALFAFVHELGQPAAILYMVSPRRVAPLATLSPSSPRGDDREFFEAEGGMWSSARASDVLTYLRRKPFRLVSDWRSSLTRNRAELPACAIDYSVLGGYERRH